MIAHIGDGTRQRRGQRKRVHTEARRQEDERRGADALLAFGEHV
jgi:hypothetical protein